MPLTGQADADTKDGSNQPGLTIAAACGVQVSVTWKLPFSSDTPRTLEVVLEEAYGALDGLLWAGEGSPSAEEILPPLSAGPAALYSVGIIFGGRDVSGWKVEVKDNRNAMPQLGIVLPATGRTDDERPALVWSAHEHLALVSSVAMTRTAQSAQQPSTTRELVPTQLPGSGILGLSYRDQQRLPTANLPAGCNAHGDGRWRWPWPPRFLHQRGRGRSHPQG